MKFGQALSVRPDLLSSEVAEELAKLQDRVPPFASDLAIEAMQRAFDRPLAELFSELEELPLAAASIAQVHAARLHDDTAVVVKILRPQVREIIRRDLEVLYALAALAEDYWSEARRLHPIAVVAEFEKTLHSELDLLREAANAAQLKRNFAGSEMLYVPEVYWDFCRESVLTLERISGIPINQIDELKRRNTNIRLLAENGVEIFFTQVFRHNFFHADMHPGNIFVDVTDPERPKYVAVDFGIVGTLDARDQHYLAENFLAFFKRDYRRVATLHVDSGWVPADTRVDELEAAVRAVCEPIFNKPLKDISFGVVLLRLFQTARRFHMEVQPQLVLLQKTLLAVEGLGRQLYPELDLWKTAKPVLEDWMRQRRDPRTRIKELVANWPEISEDLRLLPKLMHRAIRRMEAEDAARARPCAARAAGATRAPARLERVVTGAALLIAGSLWAGLAEPPWLGWFAAVARPPRDRDEAGRAVRSMSTSLDALPLAQRDSVPELLDARAARGIAVEWRQVSEQAPIRAVPQTMAPHLHEVADSDVVALDAVPRQGYRAGRLERPERRRTLVVLDLEIHPCVRVDQVQLGDRPLQIGEVAHLVIAVGMVRERRPLRRGTCTATQGGGPKGTCSRCPWALSHAGWYREAVRVHGLVADPLAVLVDESRATAERGRAPASRGALSLRGCRVGSRACRCRRTCATRRGWSAAVAGPRRDRRSSSRRT